MKKNVYEIFDEFEQALTDEERIDVLQMNDSFALRMVLKGTFDPTIQFVIERVPYYSPSDAPPGLGYTSIHGELSRAYLFQKDHPRVDAGLTMQRREQILIQILEALESREAEIYMNMLLKKQKVEGLTAQIVEEAFPLLLSKNALD